MELKQIRLTLNRESETCAMTSITSGKKYLDTYCGLRDKRKTRMGRTHAPHAELLNVWLTHDI